MQLGRTSIQRVRKQDRLMQRLRWKAVGVVNLGLCGAACHLFSRSMLR